MAASPQLDGICVSSKELDINSDNMVVLNGNISNEEDVSMESEVPEACDISKVSKSQNGVNCLKDDEDAMQVDDDDDEDDELNSDHERELNYKNNSVDEVDNKNTKSNNKTDYIDVHSGDTNESDSVQCEKDAAIVQNTVEKNDSRANINYRQINSYKDDEEVHEITDEDDCGDEHTEDNEEYLGMDNETIDREEALSTNRVIEVNDSDQDYEDEEGDLMIIDSKENGSHTTNKTSINIGNSSSDLEVIDLDEQLSSTSHPDVTHSMNRVSDTLPVRRSSRNVRRTRVTEETSSSSSSSSVSSTSSSPSRSAGESDVEEISLDNSLRGQSCTVPGLPAVSITPTSAMPNNSTSSNEVVSNNVSSTSSTIVVKDTKRLVEIAAKSSNAQQASGIKSKEPTLVIIDTNSALPDHNDATSQNLSENLVTSNSSCTNAPTSTTSVVTPLQLPVALPAQGLYPANMRATITPIPSVLQNQALSITASPSLSSAKGIPNIHSNLTTVTAAPTPLLPTLTDDMFVVEAPSFIVPYVYEKPPMKDFKDFITKLKESIASSAESKSSEEKSDDSKKDEDDDVLLVSTTSANGTTNSSSSTTASSTTTSTTSYFNNSLGKFFIDIGFGLVQEYVQYDLLRQQKRKREREGGTNPNTSKAIHSLMKNLEYSSKANEHFKINIKKCEFCSFKTESAIVLSHHLESPHMKNYAFKCNFCSYEIRSPHDILFHMEAEHAVRARLERAPYFHQCPNCPFEDNQKGKLSRHLVACQRKFKPDRNLEPPIDWDPPAKIPRIPKNVRQNANVMAAAAAAVAAAANTTNQQTLAAFQAAMKNSQFQILNRMNIFGNNTANTFNNQFIANTNNSNLIVRARGKGAMASPVATPQISQNQQLKQQAMLRAGNNLASFKQQTAGGSSLLLPTNYQLGAGGQVFQNQKPKPLHQPSISITPLPRQTTSVAAPSTNSLNPIAHAAGKPGDTNSKNSFVICEICDGYIKDLEQLRNHMQWIHKVKIHPKMIYNRPPLNCQKCQFRFFTDQGLERHLLGSHGLVTSSMQDAANKSKDAGRCPVCGRVYQWKLLNHVARDHNMTLKPAHLSYKCTVCTATFGMYKQFENHVYSAHSVVAKRVMDKKPSSGVSSSSVNSSKNDALKPLKINDEITIIPQPAKPMHSTSSSMKDDSTPGTSKAR